MMNEKYISGMINQIAEFIKNDKFFIAGFKFYDLCKYGVVIEQELLVFICSELADVYRNCLEDYNLLENEGDSKIIEKIKSNTIHLMDYLRFDISELTDRQKVEIFDRLRDIIFLSETIQRKIIDLQINIRKGRKLGDQIFL